MKAIPQIRVVMTVISVLSLSGCISVRKESVPPSQTTTIVKKSKTASPTTVRQTTQTTTTD